MDINTWFFVKCRAARLRIQRMRLKNTNCTIIADNCIAGMIYRDLGMMFRSPTINTFIHAYDYNRFLEYLHNGDSLTNIIPTPNETNPNLGLLNGDVRIDFVHYDSFEHGLAKWKERVKRIDYNNMLVIMTEKSNRYDLVKEFEQLPFKHKIALTHLPYKDISSARYIRGFENKDKLGYLFDQYSRCGMTYYDQVDWAKEINAVLNKFSTKDCDLRTRV